MNPHRSQAFILDVSRGAGIGRVHDRYIISPRQVHDRLYQIQSLRGDRGNPCDMMRPLVQSPDRAQCRSTRHRASLPTRLRAARTRSPPRCSLDRTARADPAARAGRGCEPDQPAAQREQNGEETGRPGCVAYTSQTSRLGARITGQNGRGSAKQAVPRTAPSARTLSAYLHRHVTASGFGDGPFSVLGRASVCSLALIAAGSCERAAGSGGAERPRSGAAGALDAAAREQIMGCGGKGANRGSAVSGLAWGLSCWGPG